MREVTSAIANKLLRMYNEELTRVYTLESQCKTYTEVQGTDPVIPEYSFADTRASVRVLTRKIRELKHTINVFNTTTVLDGFGITIDEALVYMSMLSKEKERLASLIVPVHKRLKTGFDARNTHIEYEVVNYDVESVKAEYDKVSKTLMDLQIELDKINSTVTFTIED